MKMRRSLRTCQRGAAAVEFSLVAIVFFMLLIGIVEMGRVLFTWNAAAEATNTEGQGKRIRYNTAT